MPADSLTDSVLRQEISTLRQGNSTLRRDISTFRQGNSTLRQDISTLRQEEQKSLREPRVKQERYEANQLPQRTKMGETREINGEALRENRIPSGGLRNNRNHSAA